MLGKSAPVLALACVLATAGLILPRSIERPGVSGASAQRSHTPSVGDEKAVLTGNVVLPPRQNDRRRFRGRAYRQRTNRPSGGEEEAASSSTTNRYRHVIVSAHPLPNESPVEPLPEPVEIDQTDATFVPHVTPVTPGTTVEFINSDPFYHNVFSLTPGARFNIGRRPTGVVVRETIPQLAEDVPGLSVVELHCDIHPQMNAFIVSLETPYFSRVNEDGTYSLDALPAGRYRVYAYMPRQDVARFEIDLSAGERLSRSIDLR